MEIPVNTQEFIWRVVRYIADGFTRQSELPESLQDFLHWINLVDPQDFTWERI